MTLIYDKERQPYAQGIVDSEAASSLSASVDIGEPCASRPVSHLSEEEPGWQNRITQLLRVFTHVAGMWSSDAVWNEQDDGLVFNPQSPPTGLVSFLTDDMSVQISHDLVINSDGKMSHNLWLFCILVALFAARSYLPGASFGDVIERVEGGPEATASLTELKATLISVQGCAERLRDMHDGDSTDGDMEDGGNHGSTSSPPLPHLARPSLSLDYDTESSDDSAQPAIAVQVQPRPAIEATRGTLTRITVPSGSISPHWDSNEPNIILGRPLGTGPRDPEIATSFSPIPQASSEVSLSHHPILQATEESYQDTPPSSTRTDEDHATGYGQQRDRSRSAERERPLKRVRRSSDSVVANRESWRMDRLGRTSPGSARGGQDRGVLDAPGEEEVEMTDAIHCVALLLARIVVGLCRDRYRAPTLSKRQRGIGMTAAELGDLLDVSVFLFANHIFGSSFLMDTCRMSESPLLRP